MVRNGKKKLWEILVPSASNSGKHYSLDYHHKWDEKVRDIAGGMTVLRSAKGHWIDPKGREYEEKMVPVRIYCDEKSIDKIIDFTLEYYDQKAVMAYEISSKVKLVHRKKSKSQ